METYYRVKLLRYYNEVANPNWYFVMGLSVDDYHVFGVY